MEHKKRDETRGNWHEIMLWQRVMTDRDAKKIKEAMAEFRREFDFR